MYDPRSDPFPELNDPAFWAAVASQVDMTALLYPGTVELSLDSPTVPEKHTEPLLLPAPKTIKETLPQTPSTKQQEKHSLLLPVGLIVLAFFFIVGVLGIHTSQKTASSTPSSSHSAVQNSTDYRAMARVDAQTVGIDPDLFERQINQESGFDPKAISPAGAQGIAQFMPKTAAGLGIDPWNPRQALMAAAKLMAAYYKEYGSYEKSLAAYNCGSGCVAGAIRSGGGNWGCYLPAETIWYIVAITNIAVCR